MKVSGPLLRPSVMKEAPGHFAIDLPPNACSLQYAWRPSNPVVVGLRSYSPKAERAAEVDGEAGEDDTKKKENERRMNFSFAVAEMIAMAPHTKQLLLQVSAASLCGFNAASVRRQGLVFSPSFICCPLLGVWCGAAVKYA